MVSNNVKTLVIDNGTGYTKMGYAGNMEPSYIIPTAISDHQDKSTVQVSRLHYDQLDFHIGEDALNNAKTHDLSWPVRSGLITDWELMEKFWHRCLFNYLRAEPDEHVVVLTEPPMNPPENRENIAEIIFETFNMKGLYIGVQAVLALYSNWEVAPADSIQKKVGLTGTVCDSGHGVTHVDGFVIGSCIKHIPLAGRDMTKFIMQMLKDRGEPIPQEDLRVVAEDIKEKYSYCAKDLLKEYTKYDRHIIEGGKPKFKKHSFISSTTGQKTTIDVGYEAFLAPEMFFKPEFIDPKWRTPIDEVIDNSIQNCPIDTRRNLYANVVLSGGSTQTTNFRDRLEKQLRERVDNRITTYQERSGTKVKPIDVNVTVNPLSAYSVWNGASLLASKPGFEKMYHTREDYFERGPSIARYNPVFMSGM
eukprot:CAMPEP_0176466448 /NCGR_PEP_ID=MMETSP0127-20121128/37897_1 /TAXON_ID=938130 /ORGANISM="Platyophrya macrostoma, Strain WH" /LENGTH=418 /DNA_ID=CAMNT_0017859615 /DNA_START=24 /DNA_END=1280 /DNA_ORIENTATION=+